MMFEFWNQLTPKLTTVGIFVLLSVKSLTPSATPLCGPPLHASFLSLFYSRDSTSAASSTSPRLPLWLTVSTGIRRPRTRVSRDQTSSSSTWGAELSMLACSPWKEACLRLVFSHAYGRRLIAGVANTFVIHVVDALICIAPRIPFRRIIFDSGCAPCCPTGCSCRAPLTCL